jgi:hypothetical protein
MANETLLSVVQWQLEVLAKCEETLHLLQNPRELKRHLREQRKDAKVRVLPREIGTGLVDVTGEGQQPGPMLLYSLPPHARGRSWPAGAPHRARGTAPLGSRSLTAT